MKIIEDCDHPIVRLESIKGGGCFLYHAADSTQAAVAVRWSAESRHMVCIHLESGDFVKLERAIYVTPITITELRYKV
mgnify:CR=1 FL=1|tara:strand:- start:2214 stop:2447 length:234 start_codon:yes stop_codon:yes gene_type:complete